MQADAPTEGVVIGALWTDTDTGLAYVCKSLAPLTWVQVGPPKDSICLWPEAEPMPAGWRLCDGKDGAPDLAGYALTVGPKLSVVAKYNYIQKV